MKRGGRWLAIDTATDTASVAVGCPPDVEARAFVQGARRHAAEIVALLDRALTQAGLRPRDLAGVVVGDGPGSFTGLRIGWAAAKGLVQEAGLPLRAVPSLMAAAATVAQSLGPPPAPVAACYDALRGQVYGAVYLFRPEAVETLVAPAVLTVAELARVAPVRPTVVVGDGALRFPDDVRSWSGAAPVPLPGLTPNATALLSLLLRQGATRSVEDPLAAEPVYGRPAEAQAKWEARHGRPLPHPPR